MSSGSGFNGCYASHILIRKGTRVMKLPNEISDILGATINCALATMVTFFITALIRRLIENISTKFIFKGKYC